jgi:hypothetical protein
MRQEHKIRVDLKAVDERLLIIFIYVGFEAPTYGSRHGSVASSCEDGNKHLGRIKSCKVLKKESGLWS